MASRILARLPITSAFAPKRAPFAAARFNSQTSTSRAARMVEMASQAEKPSPAELGVPLMWALSGAAILMAWNRIPTRGQDQVETLLIV